MYVTVNKNHNALISRIQTFNDVSYLFGREPVSKMPPIRAKQVHSNFVLFKDKNTTPVTAPVIIFKDIIDSKGSVHLQMV